MHIATEVGGNPYLITVGKSGFLVLLDDPLSLAQKIKLALENPHLTRQVIESYC